MGLCGTAGLPDLAHVETLHFFSAAGVGANIAAESKERLFRVIGAVVHFGSNEGLTASLAGKLSEPGPDSPIDLCVGQPLAHESYEFLVIERSVRHVLRDHLAVEVNEVLRLVTWRCLRVQLGLAVELLAVLADLKIVALILHQEP